MIVAIIGPDGSGKTTQARMLVERLNRDGYNAIYIHSHDVLLNAFFPQKKPNLNQLGPRMFRVSKIRGAKEMHACKKSHQMIAGILGFLYAFASYAYIKCFLDRGRIVVCDRYYYQFFNDLFGNCGEQISRRFPRPDLTFLLTVDINQLYDRMIDQGDKSIGEDYYISLAELYTRLKDDLNFIQIDSRLEKSSVNDLILNDVRNNLGGI